MNMYTDNDFVLGTRTTGGGGGRYTLVGPGRPGSGPNIVRVATPHGWVLARILGRRAGRPGRRCTRCRTG